MNREWWCYLHKLGLVMKIYILLLGVCLVGVKIIFMENDFSILRCLAKKEEENYFQRRMIFPHMKENIFL